MELNRNQQLAAIALLAFALIGLGWGVARPSLNRGGFTISEPGKSPEGDVDISVDDKPGASRPTPEASILVHVAGRVRFPNVYRLPPGSRAIDAVKAAGGSFPDAYLDAVNLAAKVTDGQQIYIPSRTNKGLPAAATPFRASASSPATRVSSSSSSSSSGKLRNAGDGYVNINTADSSELQRLPGVGPSTADKILEYRSKSGRFTSIEQLLEIKGLGPKKLEKLRPFVTL